MIKYKYLWVWDRMMHSDLSWSEKMQKEATEENAPLDCIYKDIQGKWHRFKDIKSDETKSRISILVKEIK